MCRTLTLLAVALVLAVGAWPVCAQLGNTDHVEQFGFAFRPPAGWQTVRIGASTGEARHYKHPQELGRVIVVAFPAPSLEFGRYVAMKVLQEALRQLGATIQTTATNRPVTIGGRQGVQDQLKLGLAQVPVAIVGEALFVRHGAYVLGFLGFWAERVGPAQAVQASLRSVTFLPRPADEALRQETAQGLDFSMPQSWRIGPDDESPEATALSPPTDAESELCEVVLQRANWAAAAEYGVTKEAFGADASAALDQLCDAARDELLKEVERDLAAHKQKHPRNPLANEIGAVGELRREDLPAGGVAGRAAHYQVPVRYSDLNAEVNFRLICAVLARDDDVWLAAAWCPEEWEEPHLRAIEAIIRSAAPEGRLTTAGGAREGRRRRA